MTCTTRDEGGHRGIDRSGGVCVRRCSCACFFSAWVRPVRRRRASRGSEKACQTGRKGWKKGWLAIQPGSVGMQSVGSLGMGVSAVALGTFRNFWVSVAVRGRMPMRPCGLVRPIPFLQPQARARA
eukprot:6211339-Pleurochrysis_carterae.AAC.1